MRNKKTVLKEEIFLRVVGRDARESRLDAKLEELAGKEDWKGVVQTLDQYDENNERRHRSHRDDLDISIVERKADDGQDTYRISDMMRLCCWEDWIDIIFSQRPEDLHHLVEDTQTIRALRELTPQQKKILLENLVWGLSTKEIAEADGCSVRNITKHRQRALEQVRQATT